MIPWNEIVDGSILEPNSNEAMTNVENLTAVEINNSWSHPQISELNERG